MIQITIQIKKVYNIVKEAMGQNHCCSDDHVDKEIYAVKAKASRTSFQAPSNHVIQQDDYVTNFTSIENVPKCSLQVQRIEQQLGPFKPQIFHLTYTGVKEPKAYTLNSSGLTYDRNSQWDMDMPHGLGRLIYPDGSLYAGLFDKGIPHGEGRFISSNGWYYEGQLVKEQAQGNGIFIFKNKGYEYKGSWEGDLPNGKGKQKWMQKGQIVSEFQGQFISGKKNGFGKYKSKEDWYYEGFFANNEVTGKGNMLYKNGDKYQGYFLAGKKHGFGMYRWTNGSTYEGFYNNDERQGHGIFKTPDYKVFQGQWKHGVREGKGFLTINGKKYHGIWSADKPQKGISKTIL